MNPRTFELMNLKIDGALDAAEAEELRQLLDADPKAREESAELERVLQVLDEELALDAPEELRGDVMRAVARRNVVPLRTPSRSRRLLPLGLGLGVAAALVVMFLSIPTLFDGVDRGNLAGTMKRVGPVTATVSGSAIDLQVEPGVRRIELRFDPAAARLIALQGDARSVRTPGEGIVVIEPQGRRLHALFEKRTKNPVRITLIVAASDSTLQQVPVELTTTN